MKIFDERVAWFEYAKQKLMIIKQLGKNTELYQEGIEG